jgi:hypothetical protein
VAGFTTQPQRVRRASHQAGARTPARRVEINKPTTEKRTDMKKSTIVIAVAVVAFIGYKLLWTSVEAEVEHRIADIGLTPNEVAANGPQLQRAT